MKHLLNDHRATKWSGEVGCSMWPCCRQYWTHCGVTIRFSKLCTPMVRKCLIRSWNITQCITLKKWTQIYKLNPEYYDNNKEMGLVMQIFTLILAALASCWGRTTMCVTALCKWSDSVAPWSSSWARSAFITTSCTTSPLSLLSLPPPAEALLCLFTVLPLGLPAPLKSFCRFCWFCKQSPRSSDVSRYCEPKEKQYFKFNYTHQ